MLLLKKNCFSKEILFLRMKGLEIFILQSLLGFDVLIPTLSSGSLEQKRPIANLDQKG